MSATRRSRLRRRTRQFFSSEPLESRLALSGIGDFGASVDSPDLFDLSPPLPGEITSLRVLETDPADGSVVHNAFDRLTVTFDGAVDPLTLGQGDVLLERVEDDGSTTLVTDPAVDQLLEELDNEGTRLTVQMPAGLDMPAGTYRVILSDTAFLMGVDGSLLADLGMRQVVATFTYQPTRGTTLADAKDLGPLGQRIEQVPGFLDLDTFPGAVALYRFELPEGHFWRFGAEVLAQRFGSPLDSALSLFNSQGDVLATADTGVGAALNDPYMFQGLAAGVYYLGVSATGNLPGQPGGYDPVTGTRPVALNTDTPGGSYWLRLVADPADSPEQLQEFRLTKADPSDPTPTGFAMRFSGPVAPKGEAAKTNTGVVLTDDAGNTWPVLLNTVDRSTGNLDFIFAKRLAPGRYTIEVDSDSGLRDLAGYEPLGLEGRDHVLASFDIQPVTIAHADGDMGPIFPADASEISTSAVSLAQNEQRVLRMVVLVSYVCPVEFVNSGGDLQVDVVNQSRGTKASFSLNGDQSVTRPIFFEPGEVFLSFTNVGAQPANVTWRFTPGYVLQERVDAGGVGRESALNLRLVQSPTSNVSSLPAIGSQPTSNPTGVAAPPGTNPNVGPTVPLLPGSVGPVLPGSNIPSGAGPISSSPGFVTVGVTVNSPSGFNGAQQSPSVTIALLNSGAQPVGRSVTESVDLPATLGQANISSTDADSRSVRLPASRSVESGRFARSNLGEVPLPAPQEQPTHPDGESPQLADANEGVIPTNDGMMEAGSPDSLAWLDSNEASAWLSAALSQLGSWLSTTQPQTQAHHGESLAGIDPLSRVIAALGGDGERRPGHPDPMVGLLVTAAVIEGRRVLTRWLGRRKNLRAMIGHHGGRPRLLGA